MGAGAMRCALAAIATIPILSPSSQTTYSTTEKHIRKPTRARNDFPGRHMPFFLPPYLIYCKIRARSGKIAPNFPVYSGNVGKYSGKHSEITLKTHEKCPFSGLRQSVPFFPRNDSCTPFACKKFLSLRIFPQKRFQGYQGILGQGEREIGPQARLFVRRAGGRTRRCG